MSPPDAEPLYLDSLVATARGDTTPLTDFEHGHEFDLHWRSNGNAFEVRAARDTDLVYSGNKPTCTVPGRARTTTFIVAAKLTGGSAEQTLYDAITVTISDPALRPGSVKTGTLTVTGESTLDGGADIHDATVERSLEVRGTTDLRGGAIFSGDLTVEGTATVRGAFQINDATVSGKLSAPSAEIAAASATTLTATESVSMLTPHPITPGHWYAAPTDGVLVGNVGWTADASKRCVIMLTAMTDGEKRAFARGGNSCVWMNGSGTFAMASNPASLALPVSKGERFVLLVSRPDGNETDASVATGWIGFGKPAPVEAPAAAGRGADGGADGGAGGGADAAPATGDEFAPLDAVPPEPAIFRAAATSRTVTELVAVLGEIAGRPLPPEAEQRLVRAMHHLMEPGLGPPEKA